MAEGISARGQNRAFVDQLVTTTPGKREKLPPQGWFANGGFLSTPKASSSCFRNNVKGCDRAEKATKRQGSRRDSRLIPPRSCPNRGVHLMSEYKGRYIGF